MRFRHQLSGLIVAAVLVLPAFVLAGFGQATLNPVAWSARVEPAQVKSGGTVKMLLSIKLPGHRQGVACGRVLVEEHGAIGDR